jgi:fusion protein PurCD
VLQDGMTKNQKLPNILLTPTTKEEEHDRPISIQEIIDEQWMTKEDLDICSTAALKLFQRGQEIAIRHGLILVDTKYEFGYDPIQQEILLIDEIHTPDSSRYWIASTYEERVHQHTPPLEPENIDKEFLRLWFMNQPDCDPYNTTIPLPEPPTDLVVELSRRYIQLYEMITGQIFEFPSSQTGSLGNNNNNSDEMIAQAIQENLF